MVSYGHETDRQGSFDHIRDHQCVGAYRNISPDTELPVSRIKDLEEQVASLTTSLLDAAATLQNLRQKHEHMAEKHLQLVPLALSLMTERDALKKEVEVLHSMIEHYKECITKQLDKIRLLEDTISELCRMKP